MHWIVNGDIYIALLAGSSLLKWSSYYCLRDWSSCSKLCAAEEKRSCDRAEVASLVYSDWLTQLVVLLGLG